MANSCLWSPRLLEMKCDEYDDYDDEDDFDEGELQSDEMRIVSASASSNLCESDHHDTGRHGSANIRSMLDCLHRPTASELARKRKVDRNPPKGKKRSRGTCASDPKSITPQQRVKQYNNECFIVSNNRLFCLVCRDELSVKIIV